MRTKSLLAAAALLAVGTAASMAQSNVYSLNVVGYVNVVCSNGFTLVNNPLVPANAQIGTMLDDGANGNTVVPAGSVIFAFVNGGYVANYSDEFGGGWSTPTQTITNGQGFFFQNNSGSTTTITFVGEVPQGALSTALIPGYNMVGSKVPQAGYAADLGLNSTDGDFAFRFKNGGYAAYYKDEFGGGWSSSDPEVDNVKGPFLNVGEAMFFNRTDIAGAATWTRNFTVQ